MRGCIKKICMTAAAVLAVIAALAVTGISSQADSVIKSSGTIIIDNTDIAFYAQDITYLQEEIEELKKEIPH